MVGTKGRVEPYAKGRVGVTIFYVSHCIEGWSIWLLSNCYRIVADFICFLFDHLQAANLVSPSPSLPCVKTRLSAVLSDSLFTSSCSSPGPSIRTETSTLLITYSKHPLDGIFTWRKSSGPGSPCSPSSPSSSPSYSRGLIGDAPEREPNPGTDGANSPFLPVYGQDHPPSLAVECDPVRRLPPLPDYVEQLVGQEQLVDAPPGFREQELEAETGALDRAASCPSIGRLVSRSPDAAHQGRHGVCAPIGINRLLTYLRMRRVRGYPALVLDLMVVPWASVSRAWPGLYYIFLTLRDVGDFSCSWQECLTVWFVTAAPGRSSTSNPSSRGLLFGHALRIKMQDPWINRRRPQAADSGRLIPGGGRR